MLGGLMTAAAEARRAEPSLMTGAAVAVLLLLLRRVAVAERLLGVTRALTFVIRPLLRC